jgi:hypothetical protein
MLARSAVLRSALSGALLTAVVFALYAWRVRHGAGEARGLALAALIVGYQILALVERVGSGGAPRAFLSRSVVDWVIWCATGISLPIAMYAPRGAALLNVVPLQATGWLLAIAAGGAAVGWRILMIPGARRGTRDAGE